MDDDPVEAVAEDVVAEDEFADAEPAAPVYEPTYYSSYDATGLFGDVAPAAKPSLEMWGIELAEVPLWGEPVAAAPSFDDEPIWRPVVSDSDLAPVDDAPIWAEVALQEPVAAEQTEPEVETETGTEEVEIEAEAEAVEVEVEEFVSGVGRRGRGAGAGAGAHGQRPRPDDVARRHHGHAAAVAAAAAAVLAREPSRPSAGPDVALAVVPSRRPAAVRSRSPLRSAVRRGRADRARGDRRRGA